MKFCNLKPSEIPHAFDKIEHLSGHHFENLALLQEAMTHPSYTVEQPHLPPHNQRLEFLGDAVLEIIVSEYLFEKLPEEQEGVLTRVRAVLANEKATADYAEKLALPAALMLGHGENLTGGRDRQSIMGDAFEAFLGAAYLDGGYEKAKKICLPLFPEDPMECVQILGVKENPKGALQEYCQAHKIGKPEYIKCSCSGPVHAPEFEIKVKIGGKEYCEGFGPNLKVAASAAARATLLQLQKNNNEENNSTENTPES